MDQPTRTPDAGVITSTDGPGFPAGFVFASRGTNHRVLYLLVDEGQRRQSGPCWIDYTVTSIQQTRTHLQIALTGNRRGDGACAEPSVENYLRVVLPHPYEGTTATDRFGVTRHIIARVPPRYEIIRKH